MKATPQELFGLRMRKLRLGLGMSQEGLAGVCGLHRTYVGSVERGERNISLKNIVLLARALQTKPSSLLRDVDSWQV